ncbi:hypothetical protein KC571_02370 [candidate division WWE3 bacterium]|uniref:Galactose-1-phosphate uridylyltransferase n=1 Tax=candidate division WWE3 bacterium TaxID=2053526 RepID=A0A955LGY9_UNCKA|nr:hypothetical protein [candidate division WWE3 bacterium]
MTVIDVPQKLEEQPAEIQKKFNRIFDYYITTGNLKIPEGMVEWATNQFGGIDILETQKLLFLENKVIDRGVIYNDVRSKRPQTKGEPVSEEMLLEAAQKPPFNQPEKLTPEDTFGRLRGDYCITASNVSRYDKWHSVIIFDEPNPLKWSEDQLVDYLSIANEWFTKVHEKDESAWFPFFQWNCLWRAGASIPHGHMQMSVKQNKPYSQIEKMRAASWQYENETGSNYFDDYYEVHEALGLAFSQDGFRYIFPIDPKKEREVIVLMDAFDEKFAQKLHALLTVYRDELGVQSFNAGAYLKPMGGNMEWNHMPIMFRLVDRGRLDNVNSWIGVMEYFAQDVITFDPYHTAETIQSQL